MWGVHVYVQAKATVNHFPLLSLNSHLLNLKVTNSASQLALGTHLLYPHPPKYSKAGVQNVQQGIQSTCCHAWLFTFYGCWASKFRSSCFHGRHFTNFTASPKLNTFFFLHLFILHMFMSLCMHTYQCTLGNQRITCISQFFPDIIWVLGIKLRPLVLAVSCFSTETSSLPTDTF